MPQREPQRRRIDASQDAHHGIVFFPVQSASNQERAQNGHQRDGDNRRADHRERLGEGQRMKELSFHAGQSEDRNERQNDDGHREEDRTADQLRGVQRNLTDLRSIFAMLLRIVLRMPNDVLRHHDARVHQHADRDRDAAQRHDVRRNSEVVHEQK